MSHTIQSISRCNLLKALALLLILWLSGCARLPVAGPLPAETTLQGIARIDPGGAFAPAPTGDRVALARNGLRVIDPSSGKEKLFSSDIPAALVWSPEEQQLAAAFSRGDTSRLRIFDANGEARGEAVVPGRVTSLLWLPEGNVLAAAIEIKKFSFGAEHNTIFYRWNGSGEPVAATIHSTVAKPLTLARWGEHLYHTAHLSLSPFGDEILYTRLHDPPAFSPYLKVVLRHLESGLEREVANVALNSVGALFVDEAVLFGDGSGRTRCVDPWTETERGTWPAPGKHLNVSTGGLYLLIDGRLFRGASEIAAFPAESEGRFAAGGRLYIRHERRLYLLSGLVEDAVAPLESAVRERLLKLRKWRSRGLITQEDYLRNKQRMLEP